MSATQPLPTQDELVAYLDGELDDESLRRVEGLLQSDEDVRGEIHRLERVWGMLDELPRAEAGDSFARTTVEMAALEAEQELQAELGRRPSQHRRMWLLAAGIIMAAGFLGTVAVDAVWRGGQEQTLRDVPLLMQLEQHRSAADIEFLRQLRDQGLFTPPEERPLSNSAPAEKNAEKKPETKPEGKQP